MSNMSVKISFFSLPYTEYHDEKLLFTWRISKLLCNLALLRYNPWNLGKCFILNALLLNSKFHSQIQKITSQIDTKIEDISGFGLDVFAENIWKPIFRMSTETTKWEEDAAGKVFGILLTNKVQCSDVTPPIDVIHSVAAGRDFPLADKWSENLYIKGLKTALLKLKRWARATGELSSPQTEVAISRTMERTSVRSASSSKPLTKELDNSLSKKKLCCYSSETQD